MEAHLARIVEPDIDSVLREEVAEEPRSKVLIHNDDITPYDFVITVLIRFFPLTTKEAERITWTAHTTGIALVAILPSSEAQQRVGRAHFAASLEGFPLSFSIEPE
jgi:ATP-dependent Clp protease adaptor protein ClpS